MFVPKRQNLSQAPQDRFSGPQTQRHPPPNFPYPNTINNLKLPERDGEIMHSMDETTTDAAFERETTDPSAALPAIEQQIMEQAVADIWEYWDACGYGFELEAATGTIDVQKVA